MGGRKQENKDVSPVEWKNQGEPRAHTHTHGSKSTKQKATKTRQRRQKLSGGSPQNPKKKSIELQIIYMTQCISLTIIFLLSFSGLFSYRCFAYVGATRLVNCVSACVPLVVCINI